VTPADNRFESDPEEVLPGDHSLPAGWTVGAPDPEDPGDVGSLVALLRAHQEAARGWASADTDDILLEISETGVRTRENVVIRDRAGAIRAWGSVHDRAAGRMLYAHVVARDLAERLADRCSETLFAWAEGQAREVGAARGLPVQQIDAGAFAEDQRQHKWFEGGGFNRVRTWWQMSRPVTADETDLVPSPEQWSDRGVIFRLVRREEVDGVRTGMPDEADLRAVHEVLEGAFTDHFNSREETFAEFVHRLREDPGHRWDHWWLAELVDGVADGGEPEPCGALIGTRSDGDGGPDGSYVDYLGVLSTARGRGVAKGLLRTIIADAAARGHDRVGLEVDATSSTGADGLYVAMGWATKYVTESWHKDVPVE
jgi:ribosomal protein S18 acetylase RimI-like enzyme